MATEKIPDSAQEIQATLPQEEEIIDPNDSNSLRNQINGQTKIHAVPPRLEDEGQSGG